METRTIQEVRIYVLVLGTLGAEEEGNLWLSSMIIPGL